MEDQLPDCLLKEFEKSAIVKVKCIRGVGNNTFILNGDFHVDEPHAAKLVKHMKKKLRGIKGEILSDRDEIKFLESQEDPKRVEKLRRELPRKEDQEAEMSDFIEFFTKAVAKTEKVFSNRFLSITSPREDQVSASVDDLDVGDCQGQRNENVELDRRGDSAKSPDDAEHCEEQKYKKKLLRFLAGNSALDSLQEMEMYMEIDKDVLGDELLWKPASCYLYVIGISRTPEQVRNTAFALSKMPVEILMEFDITLEEATRIGGWFH